MRHNMKYLFSLLTGLIVVTSFGQMQLTSSNNNEDYMCTNERVVLRITNGNLYSDFVWSRYTYKNSQWLIEKLPNSLDSLVLQYGEGEVDQFLTIYEVKAKQNSTPVSSNQKHMLVRPSGSFDLIVAGTSAIALEKETICSKGSIKVEYNPAYVTSKHGFIWNTGETTPYLNITTPGIYTLKVIPDTECPIYDEVEIKSLDPKVNPGELDKILCEGSQITLKPVSVPQSPEATLYYNWQNGLSNEKQLLVNSPGDYKLVTSYKTTQNKICKDSVKYVVVHSENPVIDEIPELTAAEYPFKIDAAEYVSEPAHFNFLWTDGENKTIGSEQVVYVEHEGDFKLKATQKSTFCFSTKSSKVSNIPPVVPPIEKIVEIYIPNVIAPNESDENNQTLRVYSKSLAPENFTFEVFNRWGETVYSTTNIEEAQNVGWNGSKNNSGDLLSQGSYTYKAAGQYTNGQPFDKIGSVTLVR